MGEIPPIYSAVWFAVRPSGAATVASELSTRESESARERVSDTFRAGLMGLLQSSFA